MKKIFFIALMVLAINPAIAQDTIDLPPYNIGTRCVPYYLGGNPRLKEFLDYYSFFRDYTKMWVWPRVAPQGQSQYIYGVSLSVMQNYTSTPSGDSLVFPLDTMTICPVVATKEGSNYFVYRTKDTFDCRYLRYYDDGSRVRVHLHPVCDTTLRDTLVPLYKAYFDYPLPVIDTFYIGLYQLDYSYSVSVPGSFEQSYNLVHLMGPICPLQTLPYYELDSFFDCSMMLTESRIDSTVISINESNTHSKALIFPILTPPDTHLFSCPAMELDYAGMFDGNPTLVWDTAFEHNFYQIAYGPYDLPVESLTTDTTSRHDYEIPSSTLSPTVYYQARVRAYCRHICHFHDTAAWTPWSDPVYFYTGSSMPDTTHSQPGGIAPIAAGPAFSLVPNPATQGRVPTVAVDPSLLAAAPLLTLRDLAGRELLRTTLRQPVTPLPADLAAGTYLVTLATPQGSTTRRLIVE